MAIPATTNTTACENGFFNGWKSWCLKNALDCVQNMTIGDFPDFIVKAHQEYLRGYNTANGSGISGCPMGENAAWVVHSWQIVTSGLGAVIKYTKLGPDTIIVDTSNQRNLFGHDDAGSLPNNHRYYRF
jgi:hypothetical protein